MRFPKTAFVTSSVLALGALASSALAGFAGLPISGNLSLGSVINDTLVGAPDNHDGFFSGDHIFNIWDGGDKAYTLNWTGGDMLVRLAYSNSPDNDPDLFIYRPDSLDESSDYNVQGAGLDEVTIPAAPAGLYYIVIDTTAGHEGAYTLSVPVPAPGAAGLVLIGGLVATRRRR